jgi:CRISPR/Cas system-associated exonuclease Cas4 (RecB family)
MVLPREEALRRNKECKRLYSVRNAELIRARAKAAREANPDYNKVRKERQVAKIQELIDAGLFQPSKRGRKPIYASPEEAKEAKRRQMRESRQRRSQLIAEARALFEEQRAASMQGRITVMEQSQYEESSDDDE